VLFCGYIINGIALIAESKRLADNFKFFHFHLAFPEVFAQGGFDVGLGNPPWNKIQPEEEKFFATIRPEIANAENAKLRKELIANLSATDTASGASWILHKRDIESLCLFIKASGRYKLSSEGNLNTYRIFVELATGLCASFGQVGMVVQSAIATGESGKELFDHLLTTGRLMQFLDFENLNGFFQDVDSRFRFCLITVAGSNRPQQNHEALFAWTLHELDDIKTPGRLIRLSAEDLRLFNPSSRTCPIFASSRDFEISRKIYRATEHVFITENQRIGRIEFLGELFNLTRDSKHFYHSDNEGQRNGLRLYEAKYIHQFDSRFATFIDDEVRDSTVAQKQQSNFVVRTTKLVPRRL